MDASTFAEIRARLSRESGRTYWRSLEELAETPEFLELLHKEFPRQAAPLDGEIDRRSFLKLMSASLALAGLSACTRQPTETVVPYVHVPEEVVPGEVLYFATAMRLSGVARGVLAESHVGRPTKLEGNPVQPGSLGGTDALVQASILTLYDPDRAQVVRYVDEIVPWAQFDQAIATAMERQTAKGGAGLRLLTGAVTSPTLAAQIEALLAKLPGARWHQYEPALAGGPVEGARAAFGAPVDLVYRFDAADVVLSLDADFLGAGPALPRYGRDFAARRSLRHDRPMSRLYVAEPTLTSTGAKADHRLAIRAGDVAALARAVAVELGIAVPGGPSQAASPEVSAWARAVAADLRAHPGAALVLAGDGQPAAVHALAHAMNDRLGSFGKTVVAIDPVQAGQPSGFASLRALVDDMQAGRVELLVILGGNPVYDAPADVDFAGALDRVALRVHLSLYDDETSRLCHWHLPEAHDLEAWSDARAYDGTVTILQPLIAPLYGGRSAHEIVAALAGETQRSGYEIVRASWRTRRGGAGFDRAWERWLHDGVVPDTAFPARPVALRGDWASALPAAASPDGGLEIVFRLDPCVYDGRFANNGWLQELPSPIHKITWDNVALVAPQDAARLDVATGDVVELAVDGRSVRAPVFVAAGQAAGSVTVTLGYGRTFAGQVGNGVGFDAYRLRTTAAPSFAPGLAVERTGERHAIVSTQAHHSLEGRNIVRSATLAEFEADPEFAKKLGVEPPQDESLYPQWTYDGHAWAMVVDLNACIGCNACVVACYAENNIPVVGKDQVSRGREMQWIRIDTYFTGDIDAPETVFQPMLCQHCENAPCEVVCPVNATVHDSEGLNVMVYNRCVGTRYCSNNCPYKVRRFNFYLYSDWHTESLKLQRNPDVTVRSRGVMEKCTYCVQRISAGRIAARQQGRTVRDGEVVTACQQACPADAIVFGDKNDRESRVAKLKADPRNYAVLADLNTRPRTTYLAQVRNPNPAIAAPQQHDGGERHASAAPAAGEGRAG